MNFDRRNEECVRGWELYFLARSRLVGSRTSTASETVNRIFLDCCIDSFYVLNEYARAYYEAYSFIL